MIYGWQNASFGTAQFSRPHWLVSSNSFPLYHFITDRVYRYSPESFRVVVVAPLDGAKFSIVTICSVLARLLSNCLCFLPLFATYDAQFTSPTLLIPVLDPASVRSARCRNDGTMNEALVIRFHSCQQRNSSRFFC